MPTEIRALQPFQTPLLTTTLPEVDSTKITAIIYALRDAGFTYTGPRVPGESTQGNLLAINHPEIIKLRNAFIHIISTVTRGADYVMQTRGWANIVRRTDQTADLPHNHLPFHWSAVYYPLVPPLNGTEGNIVFFDSRDVYFPTAPYCVVPHTGFFVMFPSWLKHTVLPLREADSDRIAVSLNAVCGLPPDAPNMCLPHRMKKRRP